MPDFKVVSEYSPAGDQPQAIEKLAEGLENGLREQVLKGVTGSGKTYTMAKVIEKVQPPHAGAGPQQDAGGSAVRGVSGSSFPTTPWSTSSPTTTTTSRRHTSPTRIPISKRMPPPTRRSTACVSVRHLRPAGAAGCHRGLVGVAASTVWASRTILPRMMISLRVGMTMDRDELLRRLVEDRYERNDVAFQRNMFRVRGDTVELYPAYYKDRAIRVEFFGDEIDRITEFHPVTGAALKALQHVAVYPASHYVTPKDKLERAAEEIERELARQKALFEEQGKLIEAQRIDQRTRYDVEMMRELGYCSGIENYSRIISPSVPAGSPPMTLLDFFPDDFRAVRGREPCDAAAGAGHVQRRPCPQAEPGGVRLPPALRLR